MSEHEEVAVSGDDYFHAHFVLTLRIDLLSWAAEREQALWDDIVLWCGSRQLFAGGDAQTAVVYALDYGRLQKAHRELRKWLLAHLDGATFSLEFAHPAWLATPRMRRAAAEAITTGQQTLAEQLLESCNAMAAAMLGRATLRPRAKLTADGTRLVVTFAEQELQLTFWRLDGKAEPRFARFSEDIRVGDVLHLVGGTPIGAWHRVPPDHDLWMGEWSAEIGEWRANVSASASGGLDFDHEAVLRRFVCLLSDDRLGAGS